MSGFIEVAIGDEEFAGGEGGETLQDEGGHLAGADAEDGFVVEVVEDSGGEIDGDGGDGKAALGEGGLVQDLFADVDGALKERVEQVADAGELSCGFVGFADLAEDLGFAEDHGIE